VYVVHATAELDPSVPKSEREIVVVLIREDEAWRLIKPPKHIRQEILANSSGATSQPGEPRPGTDGSED
ncbi:MAG TPA: hypothetical protein VGM03_22150, partial [Phycisphaerae bacterium]